MKVVKFFGDKKKEERGVGGMEGGGDGERKKRGKTEWKEGRKKINQPFEQAVSIASGRRII